MPPSRRHASLGHCLYCLVRGVALSEEHLVPKALGGRRTLRDAVCEPCRIRTGLAERDTLEHEWLVPRALLSLHSSRARRKGLTSLPAIVLEGGDSPVASLASTFPRRFALPTFEPPGRLARIDRTGDAPRTGLAWCTLKTRTAHGAIRSAAAPTRAPHAFAWSIAKWAWGLAVAERGLEDCDTEAIRALLNGARDDVFNHVGGADASTPEVDNGIHARNGWLVATFALAALPGMPAYDVVLGALRTR